MRPAFPRLVTRAIVGAAEAPITDHLDVRSGARWPERPPVRRLIMAVASTPLAFLLVTFASAIGFADAPRWWFAGLAALGFGASYLLAVVVTLHVNRRLEGIERQRDAFYREFGRLSRAAALGDISLSIAHDLNNPLAIVNEEAGWLLDLLESPELRDSPSCREFATSVQQIRIQVERAAEFTRRVLNWTRVAEEAGGGVDLNALINKTLYLLETSLSGTDVRVVKRFEPSAQPVAGTVAELRQVFLHLMKNALDAMPAGGTLTLQTTAGERVVTASVGDTGIGIPPDRLARIFEAFYTTKPEGAGSGLGLPIANWIVRRAGGWIAVDSCPGKGTTFSVTLPVVARSNTAEQRDRERHESDPAAAGR